MLSSDSWVSPRRPRRGFERHSLSPAQARGTRLSEFARRTWRFERDFSPRREALDFERLTLSLRRECVSLPGEGISPRRDNVLRWRAHDGQGTVVCPSATIGRGGHSMVFVCVLQVLSLIHIEMCIRDGI
ncbi:hypothetical protein DEO72_LG9g844 [Vigna unguiculata]|uniref:Uncharacterized protein n=1 Tax=Vigna unguiculata TaxID=3917 RepID=A0A4D6MWI5_VIGUN|nr:hypothetical protein DEO72_LG9g844 [Vigna unguiculata]